MDSIINNRCYIKAIVSEVQATNLASPHFQLCMLLSGTNCLSVMQKIKFTLPFCQKMHHKNLSSSLDLRLVAMVAVKYVFGVYVWHQKNILI